jgi:hypothetical protein
VDPKSLGEKRINQKREEQAILETQPFGGYSSASVLVLLLANLFPLFGVLFFSWSLQNVLFLYWSETAVVGLFSVLRVPLAAVNSTRTPRLIVVISFITGFGGFMLGHALFLVMLFIPFISLEATSLEAIFLEAAKIFLEPISWGFVALILSHGFSFVKNYLIGGEWKIADVKDIIARPLVRMVFMHIALIFGLLPTIIFGQSLPILGLLIALKIMLDAGFHVQEHTQVRKISSPS